MNLVFDFSEHFNGKSALTQVLLYIPVLVCLFYHPYIQSSEPLFYDLLIILVYLAYFLKTSDGNYRNKYLYILTLLAIPLLQYKFSLGMHALSVLVIVNIFIALRKPSLLFLSWIWSTWIIGNFFVFRLLTQDWNFLRFFTLGWKCSADYSEIMSVNYCDGALNTILVVAGLFYSIGLFCLALLLSKNRFHDKTERFFFILCFSCSLFWLFKRGFIRMDIQHMDGFYLATFPLLFLYSGFALQKCIPKQKVFWLTIIFSLISLAMFNSAFEILSKKNLLISALETIQHNTVPRFQTIYSWVTNAEDVKRRFKEERYKTLRGHLKSLCAELDRLHPGNLEKNSPTITFYPWSMLLASTVPQYKLVTAPSLQIYFDTPNQELGKLDQDFLSSESRPDVIVLSPDTVDRRDSLSEFSFWIDPLLKYYIPDGTFDKQTILVARKNPVEGTIQCLNEGPGSFLKLQVQPLNSGRTFWFNLLKFIYKSPDLIVWIEYLDSRGQTHRVIQKAFYSQLKEGVFFSPLPIGQLLENMNRKTVSAFEISKIIKAEMIYLDPSELFSPFPYSTLMKVSFCRPEGY